MRKILLATVFSVVVASSAMAWDNTNNGPGNNQIVDQGGVGNQNVNSLKQRQGQVQSQGQTSVNRNSINNSINVDSGGNGNGNIHFPVSSAFAPSFGLGGPCPGRALSGGVSITLFGATGGGTDMDDVCRAKSLGELDVAREVECSDSHQFREAAYRLNRPCIVDRDRWIHEHPQPIELPAVVVVSDVPVVRLGYVGHCNHFDTQGYCNTHWRPTPKPKATIGCSC